MPRYFFHLEDGKTVSISRPRMPKPVIPSVALDHSRRLVLAVDTSGLPPKPVEMLHGNEPTLWVRLGLAAEFTTRRLAS